MLQFRVLVKRISRSPAVLFLSRIPVPPPLSPKFHRINIFADPHPLNLSTQHFPKIGAGPGFPFPANQSAIPSHQARSAKVPAFPCKSRPLFPISYELPNLQAVCFHIHACNGGVYPPPCSPFVGKDFLRGDSSVSPWPTPLVGTHTSGAGVLSSFHPRNSQQ